MRRLGIACATAGLLLAAPAGADTVTVALTSPQNGATVSAGDTINWEIAFTVSAGDNFGLALLATDLRQADTNPGFLDIPPGAAVPVAMSNFSRPAGISNPGESNPTTGYTGLQRGTPGRRNLVQIGGGQNTFGQANVGGGVGENATVVLGVGQSGSVQLAAGSFAAPAAPGTYTFSLANTLANTLDSESLTPAFWRVAAATVVTTPNSFTFTVQDQTVLRGDVNCDGSIDFFDIDPFLLALFDLPAYQSQFCGGSIATADVDCSGGVDFFDIDPFLACLFSTCPPCP